MPIKLVTANRLAYAIHCQLYYLVPGPVLSQFEFECGMSGWSDAVQGTPTGNVQTPPEANLTTTLRRDCGFCFHPDRNPLSPDTNINHCLGKIADNFPGSKILAEISYIGCTINTLF